jgi:UDP-glucose 4-epimerase
VKALVTGGAGFIGSHIADLLLAEGHDVAVVDDLSTGKQVNVARGARFYQVDIRSPEFAAVMNIERPEVVFHQAAQMSVKVSTDKPVFDAQVNVLGLLNVLEACVKVATRKIIFASSGATYGNPDRLPFDENYPQRPESPYGITKMVAEHYLSYYARDHGLRYSALRYGNVYGPRQDSRGEAGVVAIFAHQLLASESPTIHWDGEQVRDYIYVTDVARANLAAAMLEEDGVYCIGTGVGTSVNQIYALLCQALESNVVPKYAARRAGDLRAAYFDIRRAREELSWEPEVALAEGIPKTVDWFRRKRGLAPTPRVTADKHGS